MSIDTLGPSTRRLVRQPENADLSQGHRKPSAVERLEADKAKYVKSQQVALNKQPPIIRKPLMPPSHNGHLRFGAPQPTRKVVAQSAAKSEANFLNLEHLNNLICGVSDPPAHSSTAQPESPGKSEVQEESLTPSQLPFLTFSPIDESCDKPGLSATKSLVDGLASSTVTVRRVDVKPHVERPQIRKPRRAQLPEPRIHSQLLQLLRPYTQAPPPPQLFQAIKTRHDILNTVPSPVKSPLSPVEASPFSSEPLTQTLPSIKSPTEQKSSSFSHETPPPPSPAVTHQSSGTSRKRRSLTRSKSDVSDRFSRAGADVERFFNYCGLEPADFEDLRPGSDIASVSRLRSASAPASEHTTEGDEEEEAAKDEKPSYGISVIERNARVIKWLYEMRQVKDSTKVANI